DGVTYDWQLRLWSQQLGLLVGVNINPFHHATKFTPRIIPDKHHVILIIGVNNLPSLQGGTQVPLYIKHLLQLAAKITITI
ncbi:Os04g0442050, partial [Oryza sativa Japonica Group]